jgi:two-component system, OmpR family, alkaline phosphatase synthesis response regulator PhoP
MSENRGVKKHPLRKLLLVDDDELIRSLMGLYLTGLGNFETWEADNGQAALNLARRVLPDMIIADLTMPVMDGVTMTEEIRKDPNETLRKVPIIIVTGAGDDFKNAAYNAGANIVLEKPLSRKIFVSAMDRLLPK